MSTKKTTAPVQNWNQESITINGLLIPLLPERFELDKLASGVTIQKPIFSPVPILTILKEDYEKMKQIFESDLKQREPFEYYFKRKNIYYFRNSQIKIGLELHDIEPALDLGLYEIDFI